MATKKQIEANRKNAKKSTGPCTETGKAVSRLNALKSGIDAKLAIITGEDKSALKELTDSFYRDHQPQTAMEQAILDGVIRDTWLLQRFFRIEAELLEYAIGEDLYHDKHENHVGRAFSVTSNQQIRLQRRIDATRKSQLNGIKEFERLQSQRAAHPQARPPAESRPVTTSPETPNLKIGFVPDIAPAAPEIVPADTIPAPEPIRDTRIFSDSDPKTL